MPLLLTTQGIQQQTLGKAAQLAETIAVLQRQLAEARDAAAAQASQAAEAVHGATERLQRELAEACDSAEDQSRVVERLVAEAEALQSQLDQVGASLLVQLGGWGQITLGCPRCQGQTTWCTPRGVQVSSRFVCIAEQCYS